MNDKLRFCSTAYGGFGIMRIGAQIPESHMLLVSPAACGRHTSISSFSLGYKDRVSYYIFDEHELIMGYVDDGVSKAVNELLEYVHPKVLLVYVCCVMYMSGTDEARLKKRLESENPGLKVLICEMNPVSVGTVSPPAVTMQKRIYGLLNLAGDRGKEVNFIGNDLPVDHDCEIYGFLKECGISKCNHLSEMKSYSEFTGMGSACLNLVMSPTAIPAAKTMEAAIPYVTLLPVYSLESVDVQYAGLSELFGVHPDMSGFKERAMEHIRLAIAEAGGRPISVGSSATLRPYSMARALHTYGFNIVSVFSGSISKSEESNRDWLRDNVPGIEFFDVEQAGMEDKVGKCGTSQIAIGYNAAYFSGAEYVVNLLNDNGMFGYHGIMRLMDAIVDDTRNRKNVEDLLDHAWLVV